MKKIMMIMMMLVMAMTVFPFAVQAGEKATIPEVYEKVLQGVTVLQNLGQEGLQAFMGPKGEFSWKDTTVVVVDCVKGELAATSVAKFVGMKAAAVKDPKTGKLILKEACDNVNAKGHWIEYNWPNPHKNNVIERRLSFTVPVSGTPYLVAGSVWDDSTPVEELLKDLK